MRMESVPKAVKEVRASIPARATLVTSSTRKKSMREGRREGGRDGRRDGGSFRNFQAKYCKKGRRKDAA